MTKSPVCHISIETPSSVCHSLPPCVLCPTTDAEDTFTSFTFASPAVSLCVWLSFNQATNGHCSEENGGINRTHSKTHCQRVAGNATLQYFPLMPGVTSQGHLYSRLCPGYYFWCHWRVWHHSAPRGAMTKARDIYPPIIAALAQAHYHRYSVSSSRHISTLMLYMLLPGAQWADNSQHLEQGLCAKMDAMC